MPTTPTQIRIPPALLALIDSAAESEGLTRTAWLLRAATDSLGVPRSTDPADIERAVLVEKVTTGTMHKDEILLALDEFRCPVEGCPHRARSSAARCSVHARLVVPA